MDGITKLTKTLSFSRHVGQTATIKLDPQCIIKKGYLVKSPPQEHVMRKVSRWHLRFLVLYDTQARAEIDHIVEREVLVYYYKGEDSLNAGERPLGKISLLNANLVKHHGSLHGYKYVIDIYTDNRVWHLCGMHKTVVDSWFEKLKYHSFSSSVGNSSFPSNYCSESSSLKPAQNVTENSHHLTTRNETTPFKTAAKFFENPDRFSDYHPLKINQENRRVSLQESSVMCKIPILDNDSISPISSQYKYPSTKLHYHIDDSDTDEGIVRTSSDCSSTSTCTLSSISSKAKSKIPLTLESSEHDEIFGFFSSAFQGPKLESSNLRHGRSGSHGDLLSIEPLPGCLNQDHNYHLSHSNTRLSVDLIPSSSFSETRACNHMASNKNH